MTIFKKIILIGFISTLASIMVACSDDDNKEKSKNETSGDHVWKQQTDVLKTSKDAAKKLQESLDQQQQKLDEKN